MHAHTLSFIAIIREHSSFMDAAQREKTKEREARESGLMFSRDRLIEMISVRQPHSAVTLSRAVIFSHTLFVCTKQGVANHTKYIATVCIYFIFAIPCPFLSSYNFILYPSLAFSSPFLSIHPSLPPLSPPRFPSLTAFLPPSLLPLLPSPSLSNPSLANATQWQRPQRNDSMLELVNRGVNSDQRKIQAEREEKVLAQLFLSKSR